MADQNITALPKKTSSQLAATDYLLGIDSAEGYQMLIQDLGDYIIQHATSSLAGSNQTLASAITALNNSLASTRYTATLNSEYFESGTVYVYRYGSVCTIVGSDLKVKKAITATNVLVATSDKIPAATGSTPFFIVHDYTNHSVYRARVGAGQVDIPYDAGAAVNDQLYFTVTYIVGSTVA